MENFATRVVTRRWDIGYQDLPNMVNVPSLESIRLILLASHAGTIANKLTTVLFYSTKINNKILCHT